MSVVLSPCGFAFSFPVGKYALICWRWLRIPFRMILLKQRYMFCAAQKNYHVKLWNNQNLKQMPPTAMDFSCRKLAWKELFSIKDRVLRCFQVCFGDGWGKDSEETSWGFKPHPWRTLQLLVAQGSPFLLMWLLIPNNLTTPWTQLSSLEGSWIPQSRATCTSPFWSFLEKSVIMTSLGRHCCWWIFRTSQHFEIQVWSKTSTEILARAFAHQCETGRWIRPTVFAFSLRRGICYFLCFSHLPHDGL